MTDSDRLSHLRGWSGGLVFAAIVSTVAYMVWVAAGGPSHAGYGDLVSQVLYLTPAAIAVVLALRAVRTRQARTRGRTAWALVTASLAAFWIGEILWIVAEAGPGGAESPDWADLFYLIYYPLLLAALVLFSIGSQHRGERLRTSLDAATIFTAGAMLVWYLVLRPALGGLGTGSEAAITVAYPIGDLLLILGIAVLAVSRHRFRHRRALVALLGAVLFGFAADLAYGYTAAMDTYHDDGIIDVVYLLSWLHFGLAAALDAAAPRPEAQEPTSRPDVPARSSRRQLLPYFATAVGLAAIIWALRPAFGAAEAGAAVAAVAVTLLTVVRQIVAMRESSRLREQQAVKESEERLQAALRRTRFSIDHAGDALTWLDVDGAIVDVNLATSRLLEYSADELLGMTIFDIVPAFEADRDLWRRRWEVTRRLGYQVVEAQHRAKSGRLIPVEVTVNHLNYEGKDYSVSFIRDITERKRAEQALAEAEAQLRQAQKMEAIGQLAGGIAHDFNNLLTAIVGYCDLILMSDEALSATQRSDVQQIKAAAEKASALTRRILLFSRRQPLQPEVVELNAIVQDVEPLLSRTLGEQIKLAITLDPLAGKVEVDVVQFEQAITNLAINARDAMPEGGQLTIETGRTDLDEAFSYLRPGMAPGPHAVLAVTDTGVGMDDDTKGRAFEPFFTTKEIGKGTGLGLATVYGTVKQSRGGVFIYSEKDYGTTVKIYLPQAHGAPAAARAGLEARPEAEATAAPSRRTETVLVVEDEPDIRRLVERVLSSRGYRIIQAASADEALPFLEDDGCRIDLLLTDVILQGSIQGGELAKRAESLRPDLPIIYMSGYTQDTVLQAGRLPHGMHYLEKPFTPSALLDRIQEVLERRAATGPAPSS